MSLRSGLTPLMNDMIFFVDSSMTQPLDLSVNTAGLFYFLPVTSRLILFTANLNYDLRLRSQPIIPGPAMTNAEPKPIRVEASGTALTRRPPVLAAVANTSLGSRGPK
jgi:hypothetical protein